jgi:GH43 family beta-xylosidase
MGYTRHALLVLVIGCVSAAALAQDAPAGKTFTNPVVRSCDAPDPWVVLKDGWYYFTATFEPEAGLWIWKSKTLTGLDNAQKVKVWSAPKGAMNSHQVWAPELHFIDGKWFLYYTASDGVNANHRCYVLESASSDAMGPYIDRGCVDPELESYAIDGSVMKAANGKLYWLYTTGELAIAPMISPTRVDGSKRVVIARATYPWERGWLEAPESLWHGGKMFLAYSAGHSGTPHYSIGMLVNVDGNYLNAKSWVKSPAPVFMPYFGADGAVYTVGHNCFTTSADAKEDWIVYHAKEWRGDRDSGYLGRKMRMQAFTWKQDGFPDFGHPIPSGVEMKRPSGE